MTKNSHLHTYQRIRERPDYFMCTHPDCTHYRHKMYLRKKRALCYICQEPFVITADMLRYANLRCEDCRQGKPKATSKQRAVNELLKRLEL